MPSGCCKLVIVLRDEESTVSLDDYFAVGMFYAAVQLCLPLLSHIWWPSIVLVVLLCSSFIFSLHFTLFPQLLMLLFFSFFLSSLVCYSASSWVITFNLINQTSGPDTLGRCLCDFVRYNTYIMSTATCHKVECTCFNVVLPLLPFSCQLS